MLFLFSLLIVFVFILLDCRYFVHIIRFVQRIFAYIMLDNRTNNTRIEDICRGRSEHHIGIDLIDFDNTMNDNLRYNGRKQYRIRYYTTYKGRQISPLVRLFQRRAESRFVFSVRRKSKRNFFSTNFLFHTIIQRPVHFRCPSERQKSNRAI